MNLPTMDLSSEITYVAMLFGLFVVPRFLQRFGVPTAITSFGLGAAAGMGFGLFQHDTTVSLLATLGIVSLFLFAGLEINFRELRGSASVLTQHLLIRIAMIAGATWLLAETGLIEIRPSILVALALLTPSTGFILDTLGSGEHDERERFWIRSKAVATEIVALAALFFTLRSTSIGDLTFSTMVLLLMILGLPWLFRGFARLVGPHAPKTDFAFLVIVAVACALITRNLGVYYLVGAFVVGVVAQQYRQHMPSMQADRMLYAVESLGSLFIPFYFFHAGLELRREDFSLLAVGAGLGMCVLVLPFRLYTVALHRRIALKEPLRKGLRVAVPMMPTLVFTLVLAGILRDVYDIPSWLFGGLIVYTIINTILPSLLRIAPPPEYLDPTLAVGGQRGGAPLPPHLTRPEPPRGPDKPPG